MDRLDAMRLFAATATLGSFAAAARQLRVSPSVATRAVAQLEDRLGLTLLTRTTRSLHLTEPGAVYLASCRQLLGDLDDAERRLRGENAEPRGEMLVAAPLLFGRLHVLPVVNRLLSDHRALTIRLALSDRSVNLVEEGIDVAVRIGTLADSSLVATRLGAVRRVMVASPAYLAARGTPATPDALAGHDVIAFENLDGAGEWRFAAPEQVVRLAPRLAVNSADAAIAAAEAGLGITRAFSYQVKASVLAGRLVPILERFASAEAPVQAVYPARRIASANVAAFVQAARAHFKANPVAAFERWPHARPRPDSAIMPRHDRKRPL